MRAYGYVRVSGDEHTENVPLLDDQEDRIRAYCDMSGLVLVNIVREDEVPATRLLASRPDGRQIVAAVARKRIEHIVALKLHRLFGNAADALSQIQTWNRAGIALHLVDMGGQTLNTATLMGRVFLTMTAEFAELQRVVTEERLDAAFLYKSPRCESPGALLYSMSRHESGLEISSSYKKTRRLQDGGAVRRDSSR